MGGQGAKAQRCWVPNIAIAANSTPLRLRALLAAGKRLNLNAFDTTQSDKAATPARYVKET
jgi:hypothetical protein